MQAIQDPEKQCELPKIYLLELLLTGGLDEEQAQQLFTKVNSGTSSFLQSHVGSISTIQSLNQIQNKSNVKKSTLKSEFLTKIKEFSLATGNCDGAKLKSELSIIIDALNYEKLKNGLCGAMSHEPWQNGFAKSNADLAETLKGSMSKPWWPVIPPNDWLKDNTADIQEYLSCNTNCLVSLVNSMKNSSALDATVVLTNITNNLKSLESVDFKSEFDLQVETIAAKEGEPLDLFNEMISLEKISPQFLKTILE